MMILLACATSVVAQSDAALSSAAKVILDNRCVACHSCYNAPCQLDLSSGAGLARGATDARVYDATRLGSAPPTRLGIDAHTPSEWRKRGFFSVLEPLGGDSPAYSVMGRMLALKNAYPNRRVSEDQDWMCPSGMAETAIYSALNRDGMPHGFPALQAKSHALLMRWLAAGAALPPSPAPVLSSAARAELRMWEQFLNAPDPRSRLVARYFYEHLFLAHLHTQAAPRVFFRLVRSRTAAPAAVREVATVRPYDDPGAAPFYYRFVALTGTLVHKTHITFALSAERLARYKRWFLGSDWTLEAHALPDYDPVSSANPFATFRALPPAARYRFFLDNARYFVMSFIRGPVCEGQMAVNVINDHFHVLFLDPDADLSVTDPQYLEVAGELLTLPAARREDLFESHYVAYKRRQREYTAYRESRYARAYPRGFDIHALWDGGGADPDAALTVFRHFDNAAVVHGLRGGMPKTLWVMDYPIFERIYYLLVAGFDVYGTAFHQAATRLYMDNLRIESEDLFLSFLPVGERPVLREFWYRGMLARMAVDKLNPLRGANRPTQMKFGNAANPKQGFVAAIERHLAGAVRAFEPLLNTRTATLDGTSGKRRRVEQLLNRLTVRTGKFPAVMPDLAYLLVDFDDEQMLYAMIRNRAHLNVAFPLNESKRSVPAEDTVSILRGVAGSYPNFMFHIHATQVAQFVQLLESWNGSVDQHDALFSRFGVSRYRGDFWTRYDELNEAVQAAEGNDAARMDLSKYLYR